MKIKYAVNAMFLIIIAIMHINCSSPSSQGKNAGKVFCNCMNENRSSDQSISSLFAQRDSCEGLASKQLKTAEDQYQMDAEKLSEVDKAYKNTTQKINSDYYDDLSKAIAKAFAHSVWVREGTTGVDDYLFSFASNMITSLNESGSCEYKLSGDTMILSDNKRTILLIHYGKDGKLSLSNSERSSVVVYHEAVSSKDKLIGYWSISADKGEIIYTFRPDMSFSGNAPYIGNGKYSLDGDEISYQGYYSYFGDMTPYKSPQNKDKLIFKDINEISLPNFIKCDQGHTNYCCNFSLNRTKSNNFFTVKILYRY